MIEDEDFISYVCIITWQHLGINKNLSFEAKTTFPIYDSWCSYSDWVAKGRLRNYG